MPPILEGSLQRIPPLLSISFVKLIGIYLPLFLLQVSRRLCQSLIKKVETYQIQYAAETFNVYRPWKCYSLNRNITLWPVSFKGIHGVFWNLAHQEHSTLKNTAINCPLSSKIKESFEIQRKLNHKLPSLSSTTASNKYAAPSVSLFFHKSTIFTDKIILRIYVSESVVWLNKVRSQIF